MRVFPTIAFVIGAAVLLPVFAEDKAGLRNEPPDDAPMRMDPRPSCDFDGDLGCDDDDRKLFQTHLEKCETEAGYHPQADRDGDGCVTAVDQHYFEEELAALKSGEPEKEYVAFETFQAWSLLVPELGEVRICGLTQGGHDLWSQNQLRIPAERFLIGDFNQDGHDEWVIQLEASEDGSPCDRLLVASQVGGQWQRLFFQRIELEDGMRGFELVWSKERQALGIDLGKRKRVTAPATMTWPSGEAQAGYVLEYKLISQSMQWNPQLRRFEYKQAAVPEEWE